MSVNYNQSTVNNRLQQVENAFDAANPLKAVIRLLDATGNVLSSLPTTAPAGTVANGVLQFSGLSLTDPAAALSGIATAARIEDGNGTVVLSGLTVGTSSAFDIILSPTNAIVAGQAIAMQAATITGH